MSSRRSRPVNRDNEDFVFVDKAGKEMKVAMVERARPVRAAPEQQAPEIEDREWQFVDKMMKSIPYSLILLIPIMIAALIGKHDWFFGALLLEAQVINLIYTAHYLIRRRPRRIQEEEEAAAAAQ